MEQQRFIRRYAKEPDLKSNFMLFEDRTAIVSETPVEAMHFDSTFTLDEAQSKPRISAPRTQSKSLFRDVGIPTMYVTLPLTLLSTALLALVLYGHMRISTQSIFQTDASSFECTSGYLLVNISNTWLLALSSISSTLATLMAPAVMTLQMYLNAQAMQRNSIAAQYNVGVPNKLPTPYQLSLMLGLGSGNPQRLWRFEKYSRATSNKIPPMMRQTALLLRLSLLLSALIFVADQVLHYTTQTVLVSQAAKVTKVSNFGRGLSETCLTMSRAENYYLPCSEDESLDLAQWQADQNNIFFLQHGTSNVSSVALVNVAGIDDGALALLTAQGVDTNVDYRTSSIGVSVQCSPITSTCAMRPSGPEGGSTNFNCTDAFWGVLNGVVSQSINLSAVDPNVPPLALKLSQNLQLAFFEDSGLSIPYNSIGLNPSTGQADQDLLGLSDSDLINPVYFALAGLIDNSAERAGVNLSTDAAFYTGPDYLTFVLNCSYLTSEVVYTSQNGTFENFTLMPTKNGSIAEIYHGQLSSSSLGGAETQLQDILATAALQPSGRALADTWAQLYSKQILSVIGAFTSPRSNLEEQTRKTVLVTKLAIPALAVFLILNLVYLPLGLLLFITAYRQASQIDIRDIFARLSIPGVVMSLFGEAETSSSQGTSDCRFDEKKIVQEAAHVEAVLDARNQYRLQLSWHGI